MGYWDASYTVKDTDILALFRRIFKQWIPFWTRRRNLQHRSREHRFVYEVEENKLIIHSLKGHYK
jgi:Txe/YoeB family toxin of Txe-Axe toxin-antitoxin module